MTLKSSDLESHLGYWLRFVSNHVSESFRLRLSKHEITVAEWVALRTLFNHSPCALGTLATQIGIDAGTASRLVDRLLKKKLATRKASPADRRSVTLELSTAGKTLVPKLTKEADQNDEAFFGSLPATDREHLLRILKHLVHANHFTEKPTS